MLKRRLQRLAGASMLPVSKSLVLNPSLRGVLDLIETRYVPASVVAKRWHWTEQHLANLRRSGKGPAYAKLGHSVRYTVTEILAWEIAGRSPHITRDRLALAVAALNGFSDAQRANILQQLETTLAHEAQ